MIYRKKTDLVPFQIENCDQWAHLSRGEENPFSRFIFNYTGFRSLTWLFRENDVRDEHAAISECVEYVYAKNPRSMLEIMNTKEFANARDFIVKELGEGMKTLDKRTNLQIESEEAAAVRQLTYLYVDSKEYAPRDRVLAVLHTIHQFYLNLSHCGKKDFDAYEKGARVFGEFVHCYADLLVPVLKNERRTSSKKIA
jgi:hypothetical protein